MIPPPVLPEATLIIPYSFFRVITQSVTRFVLAALCAVIRG